MIREIFRDMPILSSILALLIVLTIFLLIDMFSAKPETLNGIVVDKYYKAEINTIGTGHGLSSNGNNTTIVTSEYEPEKFLLMVKLENNNVVTVECNSSLYYKKEIGEKVSFNDYKGYFTGNSWAKHCIDL